jgi:hypothetical protein
MAFAAPGRADDRQPGGAGVLHQPGGGAATSPWRRTRPTCCAPSSAARHLLRLLKQAGWLGGVSFGGVSFGGSPQAREPAAPHLLSVRAGGIYLVPPVVEGEAYPGAGVLA